MCEVSGLGPVGDAQLRDDAGDVDARCLRRHEQFRSNLVIREPLGDSPNTSTSRAVSRPNSSGDVWDAGPARALTWRRVRSRWIDGCGLTEPVGCVQALLDHHCSSSAVSLAQESLSKRDPGEQSVVSVSNRVPALHDSPPVGARSPSPRVRRAGSQGPRTAGAVSPELEQLPGDVRSSSVCPGKSSAELGGSAPPDPRAQPRCRSRSRGPRP